MFVPLAHPAGDAQADFGEALVVIGGEERKAHYLAMDLPQSDDCFVMAFPAETTEAFLEGHNHAFAYFGGVPRTMLYDNTKLAVARILGDGTRTKTRAFTELQSHYLFAEKFGRPGKGNDAKTILKIARALGPEVIEQLHRQVVEVAKRAGVTHGRRFRVDTTVVETNVHYPTDSTLLRDGVRVLTRTMRRASTALGDPAGRIRNRLRSVSRRVLIIGYEARSPKTRDAMIKSYRTLMATTRAVLRDAATMVRRQR